MRYHAIGTYVCLVLSSSSYAVPDPLDAQPECQNLLGRLADPFFLAQQHEKFSFAHAPPSPYNHLHHAHFVDEMKRAFLRKRPAWFPELYPFPHATSAEQALLSLNALRDFITGSQLSSFSGPRTENRLIMEPLTFKFFSPETSEFANRLGVSVRDYLGNNVIRDEFSTTAEVSSATLSESEYAHVLLKLIVRNLELMDHEPRLQAIKELNALKIFLRDDKHAIISTQNTRTLLQVFYQHRNMLEMTCENNRQILESIRVNENAIIEQAWEEWTNRTTLSE